MDLSKDADKRQERRAPNSIIGAPVRNGSKPDGGFGCRADVSPNIPDESAAR